ncbi:MAG: ATP-binding protein [bacterium]|nr:ATP-binding protein [bacterium]
MVLNNWQYNAIQRDYDLKRSHNKRILKEREQEVFAKIPALKELDDSIITYSVEAAKLSIMGDNSAIQTLKNRNEELSQCKKELLVSNGYPADYLSPVYTCPDCKDTGYIDNEKCHCFKQAIVNMLFSQDTVREIIKDENFSKFRLGYYSKDMVNELTGLTPYDNMIRVLSTCKQYIENFSTNYQNLLIYGNAGVGKTFLANSIANELINRAVTVIYLTSYQLFDILEKNKFQRSNEQYSKQEQQLNEDFIYESDLLIIDDLGTEFNNTFVTSQLYNCINERHLKKKSTIISTNLSPEELLATYSERISSRLIGNYTLLNIYGDDIRFTKHLQDRKI